MSVTGDTATSVVLAPKLDSASVHEEVPEVKRKMFADKMVL